MWDKPLLRPLFFWQFQCFFVQIKSIFNWFFLIFLPFFQVYSSNNPKRRRQHCSAAMVPKEDGPWWSAFDWQNDDDLSPTKNFTSSSTSSIRATTKRSQFVKIQFNFWTPLSQSCPHFFFEIFQQNCFLLFLLQKIVFNSFCIANHCAFLLPFPSAQSFFAP